MNSVQTYLIENSIPVTESGCWLWERSVNENDYGWTNGSGMPRAAHRASYAAFVGPIPAKADICHKCDTPRCINPDHLFAGSRKDNMRDASAKKRLNGQQKTHCEHGHELAGENLRLNKLGQRYCGECHRVGVRARTAKWRARTRDLPKRPESVKAWCVYDDDPAEGCLLIFAETKNKARRMFITDHPLIGDWDYYTTVAKRAHRFDGIFNKPITICDNSELPAGSPPFYSEELP